MSHQKSDGMGVRPARRRRGGVWQKAQRTRRAHSAVSHRRGGRRGGPRARHMADRPQGIVSEELLERFMNAAYEGKVSAINHVPLRVS